MSVAALAAGVASTGGKAGTSHRPLGQQTYAPSWSPNGKEILFTYENYAHGDWIVRTSSRPGGPVRIVHAGTKSAPKFDLGATAWSHGRILFIGYPPGGLYSVDYRGGAPKKIAFPRCRPTGPGEKPECHSPRTTQFFLSPNRAFAAAGLWGAPANGIAPGIGLLKLDGARPVVVSRALTKDEENGSIIDQIVGFSPDGSQLVFSRAPYDRARGIATGPPVLMAIRPVGGRAVPLARSGIRGASLIPNDAQQVKWSRHGRWVGYVDGNNSLHVVRTSGTSAPRVLAHGCGFSWSPSADVLAYNDCSGRTARLVLGRPDGSKFMNLLKNRGLDYTGGRAAHGSSEPQWSPDGSRLVFQAHKHRHRNYVWVIRANGHELTRIG